MTTAVAPAVFARELFEPFYAEAKPLLEKHWQEIATFLDIPLCPDEARYIQAEQNGQLRIYTARVPDREIGTFNGVSVSGRELALQSSNLIGYAVFFVGPGLHYSTAIEAVNDIIYIDPEFRRGWVGLRLLKFCDQMLIGEGVDTISHHSKIKHPALRAVLERMGYAADEVRMVRRVS